MSDDHGAWLFALLLLDVALGGAAAASIGRALAAVWRPYAAALPYVAALAAAIGFLHYAIFGLSPISLDAVASDLGALFSDPGRSAIGFARDLSGWAGIFALECGFAWLGHRLARRRQMLEKYDWLYEPAGSFGWRARETRDRPV